MNQSDEADVSTAEKLDADSLDDELFEWECARQPKEVWRAVKQLESDVRRGVRSARAEIDSDTLNGLAQQAYDRHGGHAKKAFKLGREWALSHRPTFAELSRRDQRHSERRLRDDARLAKHAWERGKRPAFHDDERVYD
jgi:hypothetical protein